MWVELVEDWLWCRAAAVAAASAVGGAAVLAVGAGLADAVPSPAQQAVWGVAVVVAAMLLGRAAVHAIGMPLRIVCGRGPARRRPAGYPCPECGYDIRMTPHRCPECGTELAWGFRKR